MIKKVLFIILAVFVLILASCSTNDTSISNDKSVNLDNSIENTTSVKSKVGFFDVPKKCIMKTPDGDNVVTEIVYINKNKAFTILETTDSTVSPSYSYFDGNKEYIWDNERKEGIIVVYYDARSSFNLLGEEKYDEYEELLINSEYDCSDWNYDPTHFKVPKDIKFTDLTKGDDILSPI